MLFFFYKICVSNSLLPNKDAISNFFYCNEFYSLRKVLFNFLTAVRLTSGSRGFRTEEPKMAQGGLRWKWSNGHRSICKKKIFRKSSVFLVSL